MARINVNLRDIESGFEVYPDGKYIVEITNKSKTARSQEGGAYIRWIAEIIEPDEFAGKLISWQTSLLPQSLWVLKKLMETIEVPFDENGFETNECIGKVLGVENKVREYNGEDRNNVTGYIKIGSPKKISSKYPSSMDEDIPF